MSIHNNSSQHPILIQGAMENEIEVLTKALNGTFTAVQGFEFYSGTIADRFVVISRTHIGKINATLATMLGIEKFQPSCVINQGTAGSHNIDLNQRDIVIGRRMINIDAPNLDIKALLTGRTQKTKEPMNVEIQKDGVWDWTNSLSPSEELSDLFLSTPYNFGKLTSGTIASGDGWTQTKEAVLSLHKRYGSDCEEMESFAAAQVCAHRKVPFISLRIISNSCLQGTTFDDTTPTLCQNYVLDALSRL